MKKGPGIHLAGSARRMMNPNFAGNPAENPRKALLTVPRSPIAHLRTNSKMVVPVRCYPGKA
jgi:hypothetical protein